jgi:capsular polysaccharide biosynthesis protein
LKAAQLALRRDRSVFRIVEPANLPARPSSPDPILFTLGGAGGGFGVGLLVVLLGELRDKALRTEGDIEHFLDLPTLAVIPPADGPGGKHTDGRAGWRDGMSENGEKEEGVLADV